MYKMDFSFPLPREKHIPMKKCNIMKNILQIKTLLRNEENKGGLTSIPIFQSN
jgi:hypothetical protein